jgi:CRISPR-associated endonuclease Cas2
MLVYLACFDITDDGVRYRVGKTLARYGDRVQKSVFEISLDKQSQLRDLKTEIRHLLAEGDDCRFYALCKACRKRSHDVGDNRIAYLPAAVLV